MTRAATSAARHHVPHAPATQSMSAAIAQSLARLTEAVVSRCACCIAEAAKAALDAGADRDQMLDAMGGAMQLAPCEGNCNCHGSR